MLRPITQAALMLLLLLFSPSMALAQSYPSRPITIIVTFPPGGSSDIVARALAPKLEAALSKEIDAMYQNGELAELIKKYGGDPEQFLVPTPEMSTARQGVDRAPDWTAPESTS